MHRIRQAALVIVLNSAALVATSYACPNPPPVAVITDEYGSRAPVYVTAGEEVVFNGEYSYDPDETDWISAYAWYFSGGCSPTIDHYSGASPDITVTFRKGGKTTVRLRVMDDELNWSDYDYHSVYVLDLDVDADRDGQVTYDSSDDPNDDQYEETWGKGPGSYGAIVLPNCDDDGADGAPDNWPGEHNLYYPSGLEPNDWNLDGDPNDFEACNDEVDDANDVNDIAELLVHQIPFSSWPRGITVTLSVENPSYNDSGSFFYQVDPCDMVRIFLPTDANVPGNVMIEAGDQAIIGPGIGDEYLLGSDIFKGSKRARFGVEGIEFGTTVDITLTMERYSLSASDTVRMRVAPFVLSDHTMDIEDNPPASDPCSIYVAYADGYYQSPDWGNRSLRDSLPQAYLDEVGDEADETNYNDPWYQDGFEVGYVKAPYGDPMPVFLVLPRAFREDPNFSIYSDLAKYVHRERLRQNVGVCWRLEDTNDPNNGYNGGGNIESKPVAGSGPGEFVYGSDPNANVTSFFAAQNVNSPNSVDTDWLSVGHVDETVSFASNRTHTVVADPNVGYALLLWAYKSAPTSRMHAIMVPLLDDPNTWRKDPVNGQTVEGVLDEVGSGKLNLADYNLTSSWATVDLPGIRSDLVLDSPEEITKGTCGSAPNERSLLAVDALVAFFPDPNTRYYRIDFDQTDPCEYSVRWSTDPNETWDANSPSCNVDPTVGHRSRDCIFTEALCLILYDRWTGTFQSGDYFLFNADPNCATIEIPVLFSEFEGRARAYTANHVNCLADGTTVYTAEAHGPEFDYLNKTDSDILADYAERALKKAGYTSVNKPDSRYYHNGGGDVHCGTNVKRKTPSHDWWDY